MALNYVTLTGKLGDGAQGPVSGSVTFTPSGWLADSTDSLMVPPKAVAENLAADGSFSVKLLATDNTGPLPAGWTWTAAFTVTGVAAYSFSFFLPFASGATQDISAIAPVQAASAMTAYLPLTGGTMTGPLTLDGSPPAVLPSGAGAGKIITSDASGNFSWGSAIAIDTAAADIQPLGTRAAGAVGKAADAGHVHTNVAGPLGTDVGMIWTGDTAAVTAGTALATTGSVYGVALWVRATVTVSSLWCYVTGAGSGLTASQCAGLLFFSDGTLAGKTGDTSSVWNSTGLKQMALSAVTSLTLQPGMYWAAVFANWSVTAPSLARLGVQSVSAALFNAGLSAASSRAGILATGVTTTPGNITPASVAQTGAIAYWLGIS